MDKGDIAERPLLDEEGECQRRGSPKKKCSTPVFILFVILLLAVIGGGITAAVLLTKSDKSEKMDYGVIVDAGSSASRIYVYKWPHRKDNTTVPHVKPVTRGVEISLEGVPEITQLFSDDKSNVVKPGIAKIDPANISTYLQPLLNYAYSLVPESERPKAPIFLFATAGMRVIDDKLRDAIIAEVRKTLASTTFNFTYQEDWARVITGEEEGVYGWVTTNYLKKILFENDAKDHVVGALDLGGVSLQITFLPEEPPKKNNHTLILPNNVFDLYTYSFLKYGQDATTRALMNVSAENQVNSTGGVPYDVYFPCYPNGYNETCVVEYDNMTHNMVGTGDYELCSEYERQIMELNDTCEVEPCSFDGVYQPPVVGDFYAMSGFFYTASFFGFADQNKKSPASLYDTKGREYCSTPWEEILEKYPEVDKSLLKVYCLTSSYIYNLLVNGFGFDAENSNIYFTSDIKGTTLNWALGALIAEASLLPK